MATILAVHEQALLARKRRKVVAEKGAPLKHTSVNSWPLRMENSDINL